MLVQKGITLDEFIIMREKDYPNAGGNLSKLLRDIGLAAKIINKEVSQAGLADILGATGVTNVQGEEVQKLDEYADNKLVQYLTRGGQCCGIASEERSKLLTINNEWSKDAKYLVCYDPLDGSTNIDVNVSIGTIFCIYKRVTTDGECSLEDVLQRGTEMVAAGYIVYGSSTMLVYSVGKGVNGFTLDPSIGEFCLSHPNIRIPQNGKIYSANYGRSGDFSQGIRDYLDYCASSGPDKKQYTQRYIGSMVADVHRTLIKGGIFIYPGTEAKPEGKLRLMYECNPMAFLIEDAGGLASDGQGRILDIEPTDLHQRTPIIIGSKNMVEKALSYL